MGKAKKNKETKLLIKDVIANETVQLHIQMFFQELYSVLVFWGVHNAMLPRLTIGLILSVHSKRLFHTLTHNIHEKCNLSFYLLCRHNRLHMMEVPSELI